MNLPTTREETLARIQTLARRCVNAAALAVAGTLILAIAVPAKAGAAQPDPASRSLPSNVRAALDELATTSQLSAAGRRALLTRPDIAAHVADPASVEVGSRLVTGSELPDGVQARASATGATPMALYCGAWRDVWITKKTLLGFTAYKFHQYMRWCYDFRNVTVIQNRYVYLSEVDGNFYFRRITADNNSPVPGAEVYSYMQGHMENCILKYGCIASTYPWTKIWARNNGTSGWDAGV
jgi:hypothetical protein